MAELKQCQKNSIIILRKGLKSLTAWLSSPVSRVNNVSPQGQFLCTLKANISLFQRPQCILLGWQGQTNPGFSYEIGIRGLDGG